MRVVAWLFYSRKVRKIELITTSMSLCRSCGCSLLLDRVISVNSWPESELPSYQPKRMSLSYLICSGKIFCLPPFGANGQIANIYDFYFTHLDTLIKGFEYIIMSLKIMWPTCTTRHYPCGSLNSLIHLTFEYVTRVLLSPLLVSNVHFSMELSVIRGH